MSYIAVHAKVNRVRGRAREFLCPCGSQAQDWAYQGSTEEIVDPDGRRYSRNLDDYLPMCKSCHKRADMAEVKTHCSRGHELVGENLDYRREGWRRCVRCEAGRGRVAHMTPEQLERRREYRRKYEQARRNAKKSA